MPSSALIFLSWWDGVFSGLTCSVPPLWGRGLGNNHMLKWHARGSQGGKRKVAVIGAVLWSLWKSETWGSTATLQAGRDPPREAPSHILGPGTPGSWGVEEAEKREKTRGRRAVWWELEKALPAGSGAGCFSSVHHRLRSFCSGTSCATGLGPLRGCRCPCPCLVQWWWPLRTALLHVQGI